MYFINLPLRQTYKSERLKYFLERRINPEIGIDFFAIDELDLSWHRSCAQKILDQGLVCSVHLPFLDLQPGSLDPQVRNLTKSRIQQGIEIAQIYKPQQMIAHHAYDKNIYRYTKEDWVVRSAQTWCEILNNVSCSCPLFIENTYEESPEILTLTLDEIQRRDPRVFGQMGACFDIGHWHSFAGGVIKKDFAAWCQDFAPYVRHLHLHDNDGSFDQHLGLGRGSIRWDQIFREIQKLPHRPTVTFEPHSEEALIDTLQFIAAAQKSEMDVPW